MAQAARSARGCCAVERPAQRSCEQASFRRILKCCDNLIIWGEPPPPTPPHPLLPCFSALPPTVPEHWRGLCCGRPALSARPGPVQEAAACGGAHRCMVQGPPSSRRSRRHAWRRLDSMWALSSPFGRATKVQHCLYLSAALLHIECALLHPTLYCACLAFRWSRGVSANEADEIEKRLDLFLATNITVLAGSGLDPNVLCEWSGSPGHFGGYLQSNV